MLSSYFAINLVRQLILNVEFAKLARLSNFYFVELCFHRFSQSCGFWRARAHPDPWRIRMNKQSCVFRVTVACTWPIFAPFQLAITLQAPYRLAVGQSFNWLQLGSGLKSYHAVSPNSTPRSQREIPAGFPVPNPASVVDGPLYCRWVNCPVWWWLLPDHLRANLALFPMNNAFPCLQL